MRVLLAVVVDLNPAVHVLSRDLMSAVSHKIEKCSLSDKPEIPGNDPVIIALIHTEILKILHDRIPRRRRHGRSHIHGVLRPKIHHLSGRYPGYDHARLFFIPAPAL